MGQYRQIVILPGWSAFRLARLAAVFLCICLASLIATIILNIAGGAGAAELHVAFNATLALAFLALPGVLTSFLLMIARSKRELEAGYTTAVGTHREVDQVDSETGIVIRNAGEALLSARQVKDAKAKVRRLPDEDPNGANAAEKNHDSEGA